MKKNNTRSWVRAIHRLLKHNRKYKDRLFQRVFRDKKYLLELYNAINGTNYTNVEDLDITTLEDVLFMSMKNDKSFIISSTMNLYEHQSTVNPNMPIRGLLYFAQLYDEYIKMHELNVYGKKLVKLPMPQYIVFYNGKDKLPDNQILLLSDCFECNPDTPQMKPALECEARVINVNEGHNAELMNKCNRLQQYSQFIALINQNIDEGMSIPDAINTAIDYCITNNILTDVLIRNRGDVMHMLLTEFDEKKFAKNIRNEGFDEGHKLGNEEVLQIMDSINKGYDSLEKLTSLGYDSEIARKVLEKMK